MMIQGKSLQIEPLNVEGKTPEQCLQASRIMEFALIEWEGTPHRTEWSHKGRGVDCVRFVSQHLDMLTGTSNTIESLPPDTAFHNKKSAVQGLKKLLRLYPSEVVEGDIVQPGDVVIAGPLAGGPGHGMLVGVKHLWHCESTVCRAGLACLCGGTNHFKEVRRLKDRGSWTIWTQTL